MADLLLVCPEYDSQTRAFRQWASDLGYTVVQGGRHRWSSLTGTRVSRIAIDSQIAGLRPPQTAVFFYGHGERDRLLNERGAAIDALNARSLKGAIVFAVACDSASALGPLAVSVGARAYIGYNYLFMIDPSNE